MNFDTIKSRIRKLNNESYPRVAKSVVYIMSREQRVFDNYAMLMLTQHAKNKHLTPIVLFNLYPDIRNRHAEQLFWMIENLKEVESQLSDLGIKFCLKMLDVTSNKSNQIVEILREFSPDSVYMDFNSLKGPRLINKNISNKLGVPCFEVDSRNIIPLWIASDKEEYQAATFRPKVYRIIHHFLHDDFKQGYPVFKHVENKTDWIDVRKFVLKYYPTFHQSLPSSGSTHARVILSDFLNSRLLYYAQKRNDPNEQYQSGLSPYLHFGQISSLRVTLETIKFLEVNGITVDFNPDRNMAARSSGAYPTLKLSAEAFLEELIVRRELSENFCYYNQNYDNVMCAWNWARENIENHKNDIREYIYNFDDLKSAKTHDEAWNAAQKQMMKIGKMHGYMRMYWAKKILEWTPNVEVAIDFAIKLNDFFELDGADPNGYAGIMWSLVGIHDRTWFERPIFGKLRYMNYEGLKRKFDVEKYISDWS
jgi:deoxyribodipyrimidine photo-lyase